MCGITGFIDFRKTSSIENLTEMTSTLSHRGPDGGGVFFKETQDAVVGLGHRRLSIIDLSSIASQPMYYDGLHIVFNGEIYNYQEIKKELIALGHSFQTSSDTEVILHSWRQWQEKAIAKWHGMFAIAMFDEKCNEIIFIRDRAGVKPFFYYNKNGLLLFGSELKSVVRHPDFEKEINMDAAASFLQYGYISSPYCIFQNTGKVPQGNFLRLSLSTQQISVHQYWSVYDYYNKPKLKISLAEAVSVTESVLKKAFQYRMVADVPVGVFLSGGFDSSCVTALLQTNSTEKIKTFTIGTTDKKRNEAPFAQRIASHLGTDHTEYYCTAQESLDIIPQLPYFYDEPFADSSAIPTILVSRLAKKKVTVALSADAGDEIFAGYNRYSFVLQYGKKLNAVPEPLRKITATVMSSISSERIPYFRKQRNFHSRYDKIKNIMANSRPADYIKNISKVFSDKEVNQLFKKPFRELTTCHSSKELSENYFDLLSYMMAIDYKTYMADDILQKVDRATMSVSLEGREPFLDQDIIEWAAQLPSEYKYNNGQKKYILKQIVHKYIPEEMMERPKMGFGIPIEDWLGSELKDLVHDYLSEESLRLHGLFNEAEVRKTVSDFFRGRKEKYLKVWYLLMFQMWYKQWM